MLNLCSTDELTQLFISTVYFGYFLEVTRKNEFWWGLANCFPVPRGNARSTTEEPDSEQQQQQNSFPHPSMGKRRIWKFLYNIPVMPKGKVMSLKSNCAEFQHEEVLTSWYWQGICPSSSFCRCICRAHTSTAEGATVLVNCFLCAICSSFLEENLDLLFSN